MTSPEPDSDDELRFDSDKFAQGQFRPHGRSAVRADGQIFRVDTEGPFNVEAVAAVNRTRTQLLEVNPPSGNYAYINTFKRSALMSKEALTEYEAGLRRAYSGRFTAPTAMAWVFPEPIEGASLMRPLYEKLFAAIGIPFQIFNTVEDAEVWVIQALNGDTPRRHVARQTHP